MIICYKVLNTLLKIKKIKKSRGYFFWCLTFLLFFWFSLEGEGELDGAGGKVSGVDDGTFESAEVSI